MSSSGAARWHRAERDCRRPRSRRALRQCTGTGALAAPAALRRGPGRVCRAGAASAGTRSHQRGGGVLPNVRITADVTNNAVLVYAKRKRSASIEQTHPPDRPAAAPDRDRGDDRRSDAERPVELWRAVFPGEPEGLDLQTIPGINARAPRRSSRPATPSTPPPARCSAACCPASTSCSAPRIQPRVILDALHGVTNVKVLSKPSLVVLDNQAATLQVGDQVPFSTGTATVLTANNTGGQHHRLQEHRHHPARAAARQRPTATSCSTSSRRSPTSPPAAPASLTPTISQRRVKSSIAVASGQTVLLAGLISETENKQRQGIPILDSIPGVGDAFSHQTNTRARTELILFIRPTLVKDAVDASVIAEEMRSKMNSRLVGHQQSRGGGRSAESRTLARGHEIDRPASRPAQPDVAGDGCGKPRRRARTGRLVRRVPGCADAGNRRERLPPLHHPQRTDGRGCGAGAAARRDARTGGGLGGDAVGRLGALAIVLALLALMAGHRWWRDRDGLGLGDVKLAAIAGAWLGLITLFAVVELATLSALGTYLARLARRSARRLPLRFLALDGRRPFQRPQAGAGDLAARHLGGHGIANAGARLPRAGAAPPPSRD